MHDVSVAHDIFLAFQAHFPRVLGAMLALVDVNEDAAGADTLGRTRSGGAVPQA